MSNYRLHLLVYIVPLPGIFAPKSELSLVCNCKQSATTEDITFPVVYCFSGVNASTRASFGEGRGRISLSNVQCSGNETELLNCTISSGGVNPCTHAQDAGVRCSSGDQELKLIYFVIILFFYRLF